MKQVLLDKHEGFAIVTLNRPNEMNALSRQLRAEFVAAFAECQADKAVRVVIITGNGKAFCAGFDLKELTAPDAGNAAEEADNTMARAMEAFAGPIIGAINGHAITGGFELALACDILIAAQSASFADTHARVGILPGWGLSQKLPRIVGSSRAKEICFTGKPVFAQQACDWGLVNRVVAANDLLDTAITMAQDMLACVPHILCQYKTLIDEGLSLPLDEALAQEERRAIESAREAQSSILAGRRQAVIAKGRSDRQQP